MFLGLCFKHFAILLAFWEPCKCFKVSGVALIKRIIALVQFNGASGARDSLKVSSEWLTGH